MDTSWRTLVFLASIGVGVASGVGISGGSDFAIIQRLKKDLFLSYDNEVRPVANFSHAIKTNISFDLIFADIDEFASQMNVHGWLRLRWTDERLKWNVVDYEGVQVLHVPADKIWRPDLVPYNMASVDTLPKLGKTNALVYPNGEVLWVPPVTYDVACELNFQNWPRDSQSCSLKIGSWTLSKKELHLIISDKATRAYTKPIPSSPEWEVTGTSVELASKFYDCCPGSPYQTVNFGITLKRKSAFYTAIIVVPAIVIVGLTLASFLIPPNHGSKLALGLVNVLLLVGFISYFATQLPGTDASPPAIVAFYRDALVLVAFSLVIFAKFSRWTSFPQVSGPPRFFMRCLDGRLGQVLGLESILTLIAANRKSESQAPGFTITEKGTEGEEQDFGPSNKSPNTELAHLQWLLLAGAVNRVLLAWYTVIFIVLAATRFQM